MKFNIYQARNSETKASAQKKVDKASDATAEDAPTAESSQQCSGSESRYRGYGVGVVFDCETELKRKYQLNR
jgi:hypothetical protein